MSTGERRRTQRVPVDVWVEESRDRETYFQRGANLSVGGIYLGRSIPHPLGTMMSLKFTLPGEQQPIHVVGKIVSLALDGEEPGMGVAFTELDEDTRARIERYVASAAEA